MVDPERNKNLFAPNDHLLSGEVRNLYKTKNYPIRRHCHRMDVEKLSFSRLCCLFTFPAIRLLEKSPVYVTQS